jgi:hypothetical protein
MICPCCRRPYDNPHRIIDNVLAGPVARRLAHVLANPPGRWRKQRELLDLVYGDRPLDNPPDSLPVIFCEIRDTLNQYGIVLTGNPHRGRRMEVPK